MTKKPTPTKDEDTIARLLGVINTQAEALYQVDEWLYFGNRDTRRCLWCKAWRKTGEGHKPDCKRQLAIQALDDLKFYLNNKQGMEVPDDTDTVD